MIGDEAVDAFDKAYNACAAKHEGFDLDTSERCCIAAGLAAGLEVFVLSAEAVREAGDG